MTKLHEVIAVENELQAISQKMIDECKNTFNKKVSHFLEHNKNTVMFDESRQDENLTEFTAMVSDVDTRLKYTEKHVIKYFDLIARKEATNQNAKADIVIDDVILINDIPATLLLGLESRLKKVREIYEAIPTLQPGVDWKHDNKRGKGIYVTSKPVENMKTEKQVTHKVLYEATKEHPAQIEKWNTDIAIGRITTTVWSGMLSPADKSVLLERTDTLIRAVKKARQRANTEKVVNLNIGKVLFDYIHA